VHPDDSTHRMLERVYVFARVCCVYVRARRTILASPMQKGINKARITYSILNVFLDGAVR